MGVTFTDESQQCEGGDVSDYYGSTVSSLNCRYRDLHPYISCISNRNSK